MDFDFIDDSKLEFDTEESVGVKREEQQEKERTTKKTTNNRHITRRATSELKLLDMLDLEEFKENDAIHVISQGDIDSFSFLKAILRKQKLNYVLISSWCIGKNDVSDIEKLLQDKKIGKLDFFGGEILQSSYPNEFARMKLLCEKYNSRFCIFRNHSKVYVILGDKFDCVIESSANVNTNPRAEQTVITVSRELAEFYKDFYDGIQSFV